MQRTTFFVLGVANVAIGVVGAVLPLLPSTIFFIMAAACFARSSPALEKKILDHPTVGPSVKAWRDHGVITRKAKAFAVGGMAVGFGLFLWRVEPELWLLALVALVLMGCAIFVLSRPSDYATAGEQS
ncbi:membrane protein [Roseibium sp. TrichSKD4]|uniref:YbaN family protein n=1 Tax=Roseibium sp. TrichSKD4 TaxID=744980 RepID=UPI0001E5619D|nr:YbaN family protein [Roseibium sp. TrichSKD4]EFO33720.1 membrane protein [Roseibium sp. TrichSKD4]